MTTKTLERDKTLIATYVGVALCGAALLLGATAWFGGRAVAGVAVGVVLALSNLWVLEQLVRAYLDAGRGRWAVVAVVKAIILFGVVALLVRSGALSVLALVAGFGSLPLGVVVGGAWPVAKET